MISFSLIIGQNYYPQIRRYTLKGILLLLHFIFKYKVSNNGYDTEKYALNEVG